MKKRLMKFFALTFACCLIFGGVGRVFAVDDNDAVKQIKTDLRFLINSNVSPGWAPDVRYHKEIIDKLSNSFASLSVAEKAEFSEKELADLRAYFTTHFKNEGMDTALLDDMFNLEKEPEQGAESSAPPQSSQVESNTPSSIPESSEVSSAVSSETTSKIESEISSAVSSMKEESSTASLSSQVASSEPESEEDKPVGGVVSTQSNPDIESTQLPKATPTSDLGTTLLIGLIAVAALGIIIAIWHLFFKKPSSDSDISNSLSADEDAWFINYVKNEDTSSKDAEKKIEEAIKALKKSNKNKY